MIANTLGNPLPETTFVVVVASEVSPIQNTDGTPMPETTLSVTVSVLVYEATPVAQPDRSTARVAVLGDRTAGYNSTTADAVDDALLDEDADNVNIIAIGDVADTSNAYTINDALKTAILAKGGKIYPTAGNHDYDGSRETEYDDYFGINSYNSGEFYFVISLGEVDYFFFDDNTENTDNGGGFSTSLANLQASTMGQWLINAIAASTATWKIVVYHHPGYSSSAAGTGYAGLRWDWASLGVHAVFQGHQHGLERQYVDDVYYFTCAMGGCNHHNWGTISANTEWREEDTGVSGYLKVNDGETAIQFEFYDTSNNLLDASRIERTEVPDAPLITSGLSAQAVNENATATLSVTATGATSYVWFKGSEIIPGQSGSSLSVSNFSSSDVGTYRVRALNAGGFDTSSAALTLNTSSNAGRAVTDAPFVIEGEAKTRGVSAHARLGRVSAEGGIGVNLEVGRGARVGKVRSTGNIKTRAVINPSDEELEAMARLL